VPDHDRYGCSTDCQSILVITLSTRAVDNTTAIRLQAFSTLRFRKIYLHALLSLSGNPQLHLKHAKAFYNRRYKQRAAARGLTKKPAVPNIVCTSTAYRSMHTGGLAHGGAPIHEGSNGSPEGC
jgi:hypothetical protein